MFPAGLCHRVTTAQQNLRCRRPEILQNAQTISSCETPSSCAELQHLPLSKPLKQQSRLHQERETKTKTSFGTAGIFKSQTLRLSVKTLSEHVQHVSRRKA